MKLSSRSKYGFRAALNLALEFEKSPMPMRIIAAREEISDKYLEQLMAMLKSAGLIRSVRGPKGGYVLARPPNLIRLSEIFLVLEGPIVTVECLDHPGYCDRAGCCASRQLWSMIQEAVMGVLGSMTLQDMVDNARNIDKNTNYQI